MWGTTIRRQPARCPSNCAAAAGPAAVAVLRVSSEALAFCTGPRGSPPHGLTCRIRLVIDPSQFRQLPGLRLPADATRSGPGLVFRLGM